MYCFDCWIVQELAYCLDSLGISGTNRYLTAHFDSIANMFKTKIVICCLVCFSAYELIIKVNLIPYRYFAIGNDSSTFYTEDKKVIPGNTVMAMKDTRHTITTTHKDINYNPIGQHQHHNITTTRKDINYNPIGQHQHLNLTVRFDASFRQFDPIISLARTKFEQFKEFTRLYPNFTFFTHLPRAGERNQERRKEIIDSYQYTTKELTENGCAFFGITERFLGNITNGGSSMFAKVSSTDIESICTYTDYFNGSYIVQCPIYATHVRVTIIVLDVNYHQFRQVPRDLDIRVVNKELVSAIVLQKPGEYWSNKLNNWTWHTPQQSTQTVNSADMCKALTKLDRIYLVGSSHMRHQYHYLLSECQHFDTNFWRRFIFVQALFAQEVELAIHDFANETLYVDCDKMTKFQSDNISVYTLQKPYETEHLRYQTFVYTMDKNKKNKDHRHMQLCKSGKNMKVGLILQTGSWDLSFHKLQKNLDTVLPSLNETLRYLHATKFFKILVTGPPPFNSAQPLNSGRSNDEIAIFDNNLRTIVTENKLPYFSVFEMMFLRYRHILHGY